MKNSKTKNPEDTLSVPEDAWLAQQLGVLIADARVSALNEWWRTVEANDAVGPIALASRALLDSFRSVCDALEHAGEGGWDSSMMSGLESSNEQFSVAALNRAVSRIATSKPGDGGVPAASTVFSDQLIAALRHPEVVRTVGKERFQREVRQDSLQVYETILADAIDASEPKDREGHFVLRFFCDVAAAARICVVDSSVSWRERVKEECERQEDELHTFHDYAGQELEAGALAGHGVVYVSGIAKPPMPEKAS